MDWAQVLVYLLAALFALFLIVAIILAISLIKITKQIKSTAASAERTVHELESSVENLRKAAVPLIVAKGIINQFIKRSSKASGSRDGQE